MVGPADITMDSTYGNYDTIRQSYLENCNRLVNDDKEKSGKNITKAIELYEKYYATQLKIKDKFPNRYFTINENNACFNYIKQHAPTIYKAEPAKEEKKKSPEQ